MKNNNCKVCCLLDKKDFSDEIKFNINKLIKKKEKSCVLNKEIQTDLSDYFYKNHRDKCLINFELPIEDEIIETKTDIVSTKTLIDIVDTNQVIEDFRNMSSEEKEDVRLRLLKEVEYLTLYLVHHQLINGRIDISKLKGVVPKDDISSLKIINDILLKKFDENESNNLPDVNIVRVVNERDQNY